MGAGEVHAATREILRFWFDDLDERRRFAKDPALDAEIAERFGALRDAVVASDAAGWRDDPDTLLAAIILVDQFSRNIHRDSARAFESDALALKLAREAIDKGWDGGMTKDWQQFLYMPFMHSERMADQEECVVLFRTLDDAHLLSFATGHRDLIARFGRFPHRNAALGRASTPEELAYLSQPGAGY